MNPNCLQPCRLLVVEDNDGDVGLLREALDAEGLICHLEVLTDGEEALAYIRSTSQSGLPPPDILLLDLNLPKVDGAAVLEFVRQSPLWRPIPVIVMTSSHSPRDRERVKALGVERYVTKPVDLEDYLRIGGVIRQLLEGRPQSAGA